MAAAGLVVLEDRLHPLDQRVEVDAVGVELPVAHRPVALGPAVTEPGFEVLVLDALDDDRAVVVGRRQFLRGDDTLL